MIFVSIFDKYLYVCGEHVLQNAKFHFYATHYQKKTRKMKCKKKNLHDGKFSLIKMLTLVGDLDWCVVEQEGWCWGGGERVRGGMRTHCPSFRN